MIKVFIVASELGNVHRGYEASLKECFDTLCHFPGFDFFLFKGKGKRNNREFVIPNIPSSTSLAFKLGSLTHKGRDGARFIHELSYFPLFLVYLETYKPDIIYLSGDKLGKLLFYWRKLRSLRYKIIFRNGGPMTPPYFYADLVQHITPVHYEEAINFGENPAKHLILPTGFKLVEKQYCMTPAEKIALRKNLKLPIDKQILLSVAAIDKYHKRIDYLIREVHALGQDSLYLVALGHHYPESEEIIKLGYTLLGQENFIARQVSHEEVAHYYKAADLFVLTSLKEALGRVYVEAMSYGLPCLSHDYNVARYVLGEYGYYGNFSKPGELSALLAKCLSPEFDVAKSKAVERSQFVYDRFSWDVLSPQYIKLFSHFSE